MPLVQIQIEDENGKHELIAQIDVGDDWAVYKQWSDDIIARFPLPSKNHKYCICTEESIHFIMTKAN